MLILERKINMNIEKLYPACKSIIWGGDRLKRYYGKNTDADPLAETWELSFHKDGLTCLEYILHRCRKTDTVSD